MQITKIERTKKGRFSLFCGEEFLFSLHPDIFAACEITTGCEVSKDRLMELFQQDEFRSARDKAMSVLARSDKTTKQLYDKLRRYYSDDACALAVQRMVEIGLVNDENYAGRYARDMVNLKGWSLKRVAQELKIRGIDADIISHCLENFQDYDAEDKLNQLIEKKYYKYLVDEKGVRKVTNALLRLGYSFGDIRRALKIYEEDYSEY